MALRQRFSALDLFPMLSSRRASEIQAPQSHACCRGKAVRARSRKAVTVASRGEQGGVVSRLGRDEDGSKDPATTNGRTRRRRAFVVGVAALFVVGLLVSGAFGDVSPLTVTGSSASSDSPAATDTTASSTSTEP